MTDRQNHRLGSTVSTVLRALAVVSVVRRIGPKRIGRVAALATEGYLTERRRSRSRR